VTYDIPATAGSRMSRTISSISKRKSVTTLSTATKKQRISIPTMESSQSDAAAIKTLHRHKTATAAATQVSSLSALHRSTNAAVRPNVGKKPAMAPVHSRSYSGDRSWPTGHGKSH